MSKYNVSLETVRVADGSTRSFIEYKQTYIDPHVNEFEKNRLALKSKVKMAFVPLTIVGGAIALIFLYLLIFLENNAAETKDDPYVFTIIGCVIILIAAGGYIQYHTNKFRLKIKDTIFPRIFAFFGDGFSYKSTSNFSARTLRHTEIIPDFDREKYEDDINGHYKGVDIEIVDAHLRKWKNSGKKRKLKTVFKGLIITFQMHKSFKGQTVITKDSGGLGNWLRGKLSKYDTVRLEDPKFEKIFEVFSSDQVEARYLLTTAFMERLLKLSDTFGSNSIQCCFHGQNLLITLSTYKNFFEPKSVYSKLDFNDDCRSIIAEMSQIFDMIDTLKLNQNIGL